MTDNESPRYFGQSLTWLKSEHGRAEVDRLLAEHDLPCGHGIKNVLYNGFSGGSFVDAICRMDFHNAYHRADLSNQAHFMNYIKFAHELSRI